MKIRYFAWLREKIGTSEEDVELPTDVKTVEDVINFLCARDEIYYDALRDIKDSGMIRAAVDLELVELDKTINNTSEVAFFPPMTGG